MAFVLAQDDMADELLTQSPLALLIGMVLDQQIPMEKAFRGPYLLSQRLKGTLDAGQIASMDPIELEAAFTAKPAIHRFPSAMSKRVMAICRVVSESYGGQAQRIWSEARDGLDLFERINSLPGFGPDKTRIFIALLGKQVGLPQQDWREVSTPFGNEGTHMSVADIVNLETLAAVRDFKQEMKRRHKQTAAR